MKNTLALPGMGLAVILLSSVAFAQKTPESTKNPRHIKMTKIENGKKMELDTVLSGNDVFVWNGDTIGGKELGKHHSPSFDKVKHVEIIVEGDDGDENVRINRNKDGKRRHIIRQVDSGEDMEMFNEESGDSLQERIIIRKKMKDGAEDDMIFSDGPNMQNFPPVPPFPPMPPFPHLRRLNGQPPGRIIDLNDPNIISYKKKKLSGDREKIEIIRKKSENMNFNFEFDNELMTPESPVFMNEFNDKESGHQRVEKKIDRVAEP